MIGSLLTDGFVELFEIEDEDPGDRNDELAGEWFSLLLLLVLV